MKTKSSVTFIGSVIASICLLSAGSNQSVAAENDTKPLQFIYVSGEVKIPARYPYSDELTLNKAIEMAKGVTSKASGKVILARDGSDKKTLDLKDVQKGDATDIKLKPGDKLFVPRK
jgi:protein involved in polysaccharide export with SLBB domain